MGRDLRKESDGIGPSQIELCGVVKCDQWTPVDLDLPEDRALTGLARTIDDNCAEALEELPNQGCCAARQLVQN